MCYTHKSSVGPTDYRCHSNRWSPPGVLPSSCPPPSQPAFASELLTCLGIWWYTVGNRTSPAIKQNPCKRKVAVSVLLSFWTLSLFCETPLVAPWKSPHWHHRCLSTTRDLLQLHRLAWQCSLWSFEITPWRPQCSRGDYTTLETREVFLPPQLFSSLRLGLVLQLSPSWLFLV